MYGMPDKTLGDMIMHDWLGRQGVYTGTGANVIALENRRSDQALQQAERQRLNTQRPAKPPHFSPVKPQPTPPISFNPVANNPAPNFMRTPISNPVTFSKKRSSAPLWTLMAIAYIAGLLTSFFLFFL